MIATPIRRSFTVLMLAGVVLAVTACGSGGTDVSIVEDTVQSVIDDDSDAVAEPDDAVGSLLVAFSNLGEARGFRTTTSSSQENRLPALGVDIFKPLDPTRPDTVSEVSPNGDAYMYLDLGPMLTSMAGPAAPADFDTVHTELWLTSTRVVIDATGYQPIADANPGYDLGPFRPGVGEIDLIRATDLAGDEIVEALVGSGSTNPVQLATTLPASLANVEQDPNDPSIYRATVEYGAMIEATGGDLDSMAQGLAAGLAQGVGVPAAELAVFYADFFATVIADIEFVVGEDGALHTLSFSSDFSSIYTEMLEPGTGLDLGGSDAELEEAREMFAGAVLTIASVTTFELDDTIVVEPPSGELEDRTEEAIGFFAASVSG